MIFLRFGFPFRLWKVFVPAPVPVPDPDIIWHSFPKTKKLHKILTFQCQKQLISQKVGLPFLILFYFFHYILCWIRIRNRNAFRFMFREGKKLRFLQFLFRLHNTGFESTRIWIRISSLMPNQVRIPIGIKNYADPHADPTPSLNHAGKSDFFLLLFTAMAVYIVFPFASVVKVS
jgi:hypothetical protein